MEKSDVLFGVIQTVRTVEAKTSDQKEEDRPAFKCTIMIRAGEGPFHRPPDSGPRQILLSFLTCCM